MTNKYNTQKILITPEQQGGGQPIYDPVTGAITGFTAISPIPSQTIMADCCLDLALVTALEVYVDGSTGQQFTNRCVVWLQGQSAPLLIDEPYATIEALV